MSKTPDTGSARLQTWINIRRAAGTDKAPVLYVRPEENVLIGIAEINQYLGIRSPVTLYQWVELYGFPAIKRPDGQWMTTMTSIDQWIFLAAQVDNENRPHSRGSNARYHLARRRLDARIDEQELREARSPSRPYRGFGPRSSWGEDPGRPPDHPTAPERSGGEGEQS